MILSIRAFLNKILARLYKFTTNNNAMLGGGKRKGLK